MATDQSYIEAISGLDRAQIEVFNQVCKAIDFSNNYLDNSSKTISVLNTACSLTGDSITSTDIVMGNTSYEVQIKVAGEVVKTIVYEIEMMGVKASALAVAKEVAVAVKHPIGASVAALVSGGSVYYVGDKAATDSSKQFQTETENLLRDYFSDKTNNDIQNKDNIRNIELENNTSSLGIGEFLSNTFVEDDTFQGTGGFQEWINDPSTIIPIDNNEHLLKPLSEMGIEQVSINNQMVQIVKGNEFLDDLSEKYDIPKSKILANNADMSTNQGLFEQWGADNQKRSYNEDGYALIKADKQIKLDTFEGGYGNIQQSVSLDGVETYEIPYGKETRIVKFNPKTGDLVQIGRAHV